jgi:two-component system response regulator AtoC
LPPLRARTGDVEALARHFIAELNESGLRRVDHLAPDALEAMLAYSWPGNVRELRNVIELAFAVGEGDTIGVDELPPELRGESPPFNLADEHEHDPRGDERDRIRAALRASGGRKQVAAAALGMSRTTLWRKMRELGS